MNGTPTHASARIIFLALASGVMVIWAVAIAITGAGSTPFAEDLPLTPLTLLSLYLGVSLAGLAAALAMRRKARIIAGTSADVGRMQSLLIGSWATLEGAAIIGAVLFMLSGMMELLYVAGSIYIIGLSLTFPLQEWYESDGRAHQAVSSRQ